MRSILFFIGKYPNIGGTERITTLLANQFIKQGYYVSIIACESHCDLNQMGLDSSVFVCHLPMKKPFPTIRNILFVRNIIITKRVNVVINQWCLPFFVTMLINSARRHTSCKLVSVLHGIPNCSKIVLQKRDAIKKSKSLLQRLLTKSLLFFTDNIVRNSIRWVYNNSDRYVLLSSRFIPLMNSYAKIENLHRIISIENPITIQTNYFDTSFLAQKKKQLLYVGRMDKENKRVNRILEVWNDLYIKYPDWKLVLVGDGPHRKELQEYVYQRSLERVSFAGFIKEDPIEYYRQSSILLLTSDLEGFGLAVLEAMSYGVVPVVYGSYESINDIITNGENGFITHVPFCHKEMEDYITYLIENENVLKRMSVNALESSKHYDIQSILQQWNNLFNQLI